VSEARPESPGTNRPVSDRPAAGAPRALNLLRLFLAASVLGLLLAGPLVVAIVDLRAARWHPTLELAETELHVRDVGTGHTPLTGLIGRLGTVEDRGSHPGPLSFVALAPVYRLAGSSPWALQVATVVLHLTAIAGMLWIAHRRGGRRLLLLFAAAATILLRFYGAALLTEPWNPYLPMLWWVMFIMAVWSVIEDDLVLLPVAVAAGSLCAQTHVSYVGLVAALGGWAVVTVAVRGWRRRARGLTAAQSYRWLAISAAIGVVLWLPPVVDELTQERGNLTVLIDSFSSSEDAIGFSRGLRLVLTNLDPATLLFGHADAKALIDPSWPVGALLLLSVWSGSIIVAWRLEQRALMRLHVTLGIVLTSGVFASSRIYGATWAWLVQWVWGVTALMVVAIAWTASAVVRNMPTYRRSVRIAGIAGIGALAAVALGSAGALTSDATHVEPEDVASSGALQDLVPATVEFIDRSGSGSKRNDRYLITSSDPIGLIGAAQSFGLVNELDRRGIAVGLYPNEKLRAAPYLTSGPADATATLRVVTGAAIAEWKVKPGARRIAFHDPRTNRERTTQERLRREIEEELRALRMPERIVAFRQSLIGSIFVFDTDPRIPDRLVDKMKLVFELGAPSAVYIER